MFKVLVTGSVLQDGLDILDPFSNLVILHEPIGEDDLIRHIGDSDAILHKMGRLSATVLSHQTRLKIIARHGVGLDLIDLKYAGKLGIPITITSGANANAVAELTIGLAISLIRNIPQADESMKKRHLWQRERFMGFELGELTIGIVGMGKIGRIVARLMRAFGARVLSYDPFTTTPEPEVQSVALQELLSQSDLITFHCPLNDSTRNMINRGNIAYLRDGAYIINTARGGLIESDVLLENLRNGKIGGAAIDSYMDEPPDFNDELFKMDNVVTTPHIGAMSYGSQRAMAVAAATEIKRVLYEKKPPQCNIIHS